MNVPLHTAGILQAKAYRTLQARVNGCLHAHGLNHGQWVMLSVVAEARTGIRLNSTAELLSVKAPMVTAMANELINEGYLIRISHHTDRRAKLLVVSPAGERLLAIVQRELATLLQSLLEGLTAAELRSYHKVLATIIANSAK